MAGAFRCRFNLTSMLILIVALLERGLRLLGKAWRLFGKYHLQVGGAAAVLLAIINTYMYSQSCQNFEVPDLTHGYSPLFPSHYFHQPLTSAQQDLSGDKLHDQAAHFDAYLNSNLVRNSLDLSVPPIVHITWCAEGPFEYTHFLSVLAAFKILNPSVLNLHVLTLPYKDADGYYQFLDDLKRDLPPLLIKELQDKQVCYGNIQQKLKSILSLIGEEGGIAMSAEVVLVPSATISSKFLMEKISIGQSSASREPLVVFLQSNAYKGTSHTDQLISSSTLFDCTEPNKFSISSTSVCVSVEEEIFPKMIFQGNHHLYFLLRWIGYGSSAELVPKPANVEIVPNIVHYVWLGKRHLKYFAYLSILSSLHVLQAEAVYVHGDIEPLGELWQEVKLNPRVKFIQRNFPSSVFGQPIVKFASHASDYLRGDLLLRYGGVYADWDVIFLQEMPSIMRRYNTTANVDWPETGDFPDVFNLGVLVAAPGAPFLRHFLESYRWYLDGHWSYNAIHMPYKVYEKIPGSLNVDRHLQILCAKQKCHATWLKDYKSTSIDHLGSHSIDWTKDALAIHWTYPDPPAFENKDSLLRETSPAAMIGQYVLQKADKLKNN
ncbi:hypothetical protein EGW08_011765 [Elysia chlorotica]|uniref:Alpha-1,4-N-acetylglucosaminyltransferase n=1 Tax=Elysia chlorotica TaxID=188477 RepID=A0A433TFX0_ELYCH|nr:hypothetical protein EGW08_011765 [Elysia chlorotica]